MTAPRVTYAVARVAPAAARDDLLRLWSENLTLETPAAEKFDWLYRDAPLCPEHVWLVKESVAGAAVGTAGMGLRRFQVPGAPEATAGLLADLAVDKAHRSLGPALAIVRELKAWADAHHQLAYGFPNKLAQGVFKRAGYHALGTITRYARVLRHAGYAARVRELDLARVPAAARDLLYRAAEQPWFAAVAGAAVDVAQLARRSPAAVEAARRLRIEDAAVPDAGDLDELWARARGEYEVCAHRGGAVARWRFPASPSRRWYLARARDGSALRSYAVVERTDDGAAHIKDLFGHRPDVLGLLELLPAHAYRAGATSLSMRYLGAPWLAEALVARGFAARQSDRLIVVTGGPDAVREPDRWHLTDFDEDA